jgi:hypothetical protein
MNLSIQYTNHCAWHQGVWEECLLFHGTHESYKELFHTPVSDIFPPDYNQNFNMCKTDNLSPLQASLISVNNNHNFLISEPSSHIFMITKAVIYLHEILGPNLTEYEEYHMTRW